MAGLSPVLFGKSVSRLVATTDFEWVEGASTTTRATTATGATVERPHRQCSDATVTEKNEDDEEEEEAAQLVDDRRTRQRRPPLGVGVEPSFAMAAVAADPWEEEEKDASSSFDVRRRQSSSS